MFSCLYPQKRQRNVTALSTTTITEAIRNHRSTSSSLDSLLPPWKRASFFRALMKVGSPEIPFGICVMGSYREFWGKKDQALNYKDACDIWNIYIDPEGTRPLNISHDLRDDVWKSLEREEAPQDLFDNIMIAAINQGMENKQQNNLL